MARRTVQFTISVDDAAQATIKLPEGGGQQRDANTIASLTENIGKALGKITERHIGKMVDGVHVHEDGTIHHHH